MTFWPIAIAPIAFLFSATSVRAEVFPEKYFADIDKGGATSQIAGMHLNSIYQGMAWANSFNDGVGNKPLFCPPSKMVMETEQINSITRNFYNKNKYLSDSPIGLVLMLAMQDTFPCEGGKK